MKLQDLTKKLLDKKQIVVVEFKDKRCLTFLVTDCEHLNVPGYPAQSLSRYSHIIEAREAIKRIYKKFNYQPKNNSGFSSVYRGEL